MDNCKEKIDLGHYWDLRVNRVLNSRHLSLRFRSRLLSRQRLLQRLLGSRVLVFSNFSSFIPIRLKCQKWTNFPGVDFLVTALKFRKRKKIRLLLFTSSIKRKIRHFHVVILQRW